jgi:hypothetical protein
VPGEVPEGWTWDWGELQETATRVRAMARVAAVARLGLMRLLGLMSLRKV